MKKPLTLIATAALFAIAPVQAQSFPSEPIRLIVGAAAGGGPDSTGRTLAPRLSEALGQQVVVANRAGANGAIGADVVAKAPADGHTWLFATGQHSAHPSGILVPAGTNPAIVERIHTAVVKTIAIPEVRTALLAQGTDPVTETPAGFRDFIRNEVVGFSKILATAGDAKPR